MKTFKQALVIVLSMLLGAAVCFGIMVNRTPEAPKGDVTLTNEEYEHLKYMDEKYKQVEDLWKTIDDEFYKEVDEEALKNGIISGLFQGLGDPYSEYMDPDTYATFTESLSGEFEGVGVTYIENQDGDGYKILVVHKGSPAEKAGLKEGDIMLKVDDKTYDSITEFGTALRGESGTEVSLTYERNGKEKTVKMIRAKINTTSVQGEMLEDKIGYIRIMSFESDTFEEFQTTYSELEKKDMKGLVIDLRDNGGGLVNQAQKVADMLLGSCELYYTEDGKGRQQHYSSDADKISIPYVVLVNENTASASEILSVAIQDNKGGTLVGTKTYGKGVIQYDRALENGGGYRLTIMQYFSPSGNTIHEVGITPDVVVENKDEKTDAQLNKALDLLKK